jgi:hypothetical protein
MHNLHLQYYRVFIPITSRVIIGDFRLRISDFGLMESLRSINYNGPFDTKAHDRQNSLNPNIVDGLIRVQGFNRFYPMNSANLFNPINLIPHNPVVCLGNLCNPKSLRGVGPYVPYGPEAEI